MSKSFVRALWGNIFTLENQADRGSKLKEDIQRAIVPFDKFPFVVYTFGKLNHESLLKIGIESRLICNNPSKWDMKTELYRHKLEVFKHAMDDFDEIVFLDWDCIPVSKIYSDFWDKLNQKESFQANLFQYRTKKCLWREEDPRKVTNGGFVYLRDKNIPDKFIKNWDSLKIWSESQNLKRQEKGKALRFRERCLTFDDEPAMSKYVDDTLSGWKGSEVYWNLFEPSVCNLRKKSVYSEIENKSKNACFLHML